LLGEETVDGGKSMRKYVFAIFTAALFAIPSVAFSEGVHIGPRDVKVVPSYDRYHARQSAIEILRDTIRFDFRSTSKAYFIGE
jgi:hypothetical protein